MAQMKTRSIAASSKAPISSMPGLDNMGHLPFISGVAHPDLGASDYESVVNTSPLITQDSPMRDVAAVLHMLSVMDRIEGQEMRSGLRVSNDPSVFGSSAPAVNRQDYVYVTVAGDIDISSCVCCRTGVDRYQGTACSNCPPTDLEQQRPSSVDSGYESDTTIPDPNHPVEYITPMEKKGQKTKNANPKRGNGDRKSHGGPRLPKLGNFKVQRKSQPNGEGLSTFEDPDNTTALMAPPILSAAQSSTVLMRPSSSIPSVGYELTAEGSAVPPTQGPSVGDEEDLDLAGQHCNDERNVERDSTGPEEGSDHSYFSQVRSNNFRNQYGQSNHRKRSHSPIQDYPVADVDDMTIGPRLNTWRFKYSGKTTEFTTSDYSKANELKERMIERQARDDEEMYQGLTKFEGRQRGWNGEREPDRRLTKQTMQEQQNRKAPEASELDGSQCQQKKQKLSTSAREVESAFLEHQSRRLISQISLDDKIMKEQASNHTKMMSRKWDSDAIVKGTMGAGRKIAKPRPKPPAFPPRQTTPPKPKKLVNKSDSPPLGPPMRTRAQSRRDTTVTTSEKPEIDPLRKNLSLSRKISKDKMADVPPVDKK